MTLSEFCADTPKIIANCLPIVWLGRTFFVTLPQNNEKPLKMLEKTMEKTIERLRTTAMTQLRVSMTMAVVAAVLALVSCDGMSVPKGKGMGGVVPDFPTSQNGDAYDDASDEDEYADADFDDGTTDEADETRQSRGNEKNLEMPLSSRGDNVIRHTGYALSYNSETNCPNWVAWELTRSEASAHGSRNPDFYPDPQVDGRHQVTTQDYKGSGYTRGHMCPAGDMKWSSKAQHDCFYMTNMCPQTKDLNADSWEVLESACRRWAKSEGSVYIVCGPVYNEGRKVRFIGRQHKVRVPDGFFKVVLSMKRGQEKAIGFYYANNDRFQTMESAAMSVDEVERMTGYNFFHLVDDNIENRVEANCNLRDWD